MTVGCNPALASIPVKKANVQTENSDDADIIRRVLGGEVNAFELLLKRYGPFVHALAGRHVPGDRVEEVAQDVFVSAFRALPSYSGRSEFRHWLAKIAVRRCHDFWRERHRARETPFSQFSEEHQAWLEGLLASDSAESFNNAAARVEARELLDYALDRISPADRTALTLVYLDGVPVKEAAELLGWNSVLLRVRVHRAKSMLRKIISGLLEMRGHDEKES